ncbi:substrate-binding periplasmic protein [Arthrobacter mobilis]|uniref:Amino acid ABC transporter substrate-binding protein n=1 Tax=Arthrobacter mobilis TaxID=2724944 RepID=A0A7X6K7Q6_9MICC|nr:transporter substrate-binding domain-containing protein [Arthrobacter mobilis]NKX56669.1 amino acid ABC transporter substrate-binding protein [Arthrobacter mobilis]
MKTLIRRGTIALVLLGAAALSGCAADAQTTVASDCVPASKFNTLHEGKLSVVGPDYPPLFTYQNSKIDGVDGKILESFAKANCLELDVKVLPAAGVIEAVKGRQADVAAGGWYPTEERAKIVNQSEPAYGDPAVLVGKNPSGQIEDYEGKTIGTTQGYLWVDDLVKWAGDKAKLYQSPDAVYQDLLNGRIDVAMMAVNEAAGRLDQSPDSGLSYVEMAETPLIEATQHPSVTNLPHTKGNTELTEAINSHLEKIRNDGSLAKILGDFGIDESQAKPESE